MPASLSILRVSLLALGLVVAGWPVADASLDAQFRRPARERITEAQIRGHMEMLASDALQGRASGSRDELIAATYIASQLRQWGLEPLGDAGGFVQAVATPRGQTWNVLARISGSDRRRTEAILLSAHLDHVGMRGTDGDTIFNGADDDASGVTAVLELARVFASSRRPRRTILFAWFGSEEVGGAGSRHFADHPPVPLASIVANLQFEMIGRPDAAVAANALWLTGFERSTLGPALARRGARLVPDPHPAQNFFFRSDNIQFALRGVVAHTVSSFGLHRDYHTPADEVARIDFPHMTAAIRSMVDPILWLAGSDFLPAWRPGLKPEPGRRGGT